jgi:hypothetical protein
LSEPAQHNGPLHSGIPGVVRLPDDEWQFYPSTDLNSNRRLLVRRRTEDLYLWHAHELFSVLIGDEALAGRIQCLFPLRDRFLQAWGLFPEWPLGRYMGIDRAERARRLEVIFGDNPLVIEPSLASIPRNIYAQLRHALIYTHKPLVRGHGDVDLALIQIPWQLPDEHLLPLVCDYIRYLRTGCMVSALLKTGGKGGLLDRRQQELIRIGRYRLFAANRFNLECTKEAASLDVRSDGRIFTRAKRFIDSLSPRRWSLLNKTLSAFIEGVLGNGRDGLSR